MDWKTDSNDKRFLFYMTTYSSGLRGQSAKLLFVGSNPTVVSMRVGVIGNTSASDSDI